MLLSDSALLERLVSFDTVSRRPTLPLVEWISDYLDRPGVEVSIQRAPTPGKANLVALVRPEPPVPANDRDGLILCGHLDVVPAEGWEGDPFRMVERDGRYFGRGTCDMKGFCALSINRIARVDPGELEHPLALLLTCDEEVGCLGARHFVESWPTHRPLPRNVLVGEPTSLRAVRLHKGHLKLRVRIRGMGAHTGSPHLGVNAVESAAPVLDALSRLGEALEAEGSVHGRHFGEAPGAILTVTGIRGGEAFNVVPALCEIDVGIRLMPGDTPSVFVERVRAGVEGAAPDEGTVEVEVAGVTPPLETPPDAPLYRAVSDRIGQKETFGVSFASDAGWLAEAGYDCVLFGPGSMEVAHRPEEYLSAAELEAGGRHLDALIGTLCGAAEAGVS